MCGPRDLPPLLPGAAVQRSRAGGGPVGRGPRLGNVVVTSSFAGRPSPVACRGLPRGLDSGHNGAPMERTNLLKSTPEAVLGPLNEVERKNAPEFLYLAGDVSLLRNGPRVSVVGSRDVTDEGRKRTRALSKLLVERGAVVVSGLAEGVDTEAHEAAIRSGGHTVAVLGTPLSEAYPQRNRTLQEQIMREHLAVSQFAHSGGRRRFPMRNRTMALVSDATVVVEAQEASGSRHQGWEALRLGRPLFLMESLARSNLSWVEEMLGYGAQVLSRDDIDFQFEFLPQGTRGDTDSVAF